MALDLWLRETSAVTGGFLWISNTISLLLARHPGARVHLLPYEPPEPRSALRTALEALGATVGVLEVGVDEVREPGGARVAVPGVRPEPVSAAALTQLVAALNQAHAYSLVVVRSYDRSDTVSAVAKALGSLHRVWVQAFPGTVREDNKILVTQEQGGTLVLQSPMQLSRDPEARRREVWLPPLVNFALAAAPRAAPRHRQAVCYIGAYGNGHQYLVDELVLAWPLVRERFPAATLHIVLGFGAQKFPSRLRTAPGVNVSVTSISHEAAIAMYRHHCDVGVRGLDARNPPHMHAMISTKIIEMGATALPIVVNPSPINDHLLGTDYPLRWPYTATMPQAFAAVLLNTMSQPALYELASRRVLDMAHRFTFDSILAQLPA